MKKVYFADFETTQPNKDNKVFVYLWCILSGNEVYTGKTLETFINKLETLNGVVYFHNLKFDFSYIHYYLIKNNIEYKLLEKKGTIYQVKLFDIQLRDSMNFLPMSLKEVGENYCTKYQKTSIDYNVQEGHDATEEEITYCINDCRVIEEGLTNYLNTLEEILKSVNCNKSVKKLHKKLTNAGIAFEAFKELSMFEQLCPKTSKQQYDAWKGSYRGGFVYSNPKGIVTNVKMIDCNSMYPHIYSTIEMPYGNAFKFNDWQKLERYKFYIVNIFIKYELKPGYIPIIGGGVSKYGGINYKSSSNGEFEELTLCNIDLELIKRFYKLGFNIVATEGTSKFLKENNVKNRILKKFKDNSNDIADLLRTGFVSYVINTSELGVEDLDGTKIRALSIETNTPLFTALDTVPASCSP